VGQERDVLFASAKGTDVCRGKLNVGVSIARIYRSYRLTLCSALKFRRLFVTWQSRCDEGEAERGRGL